ncbi:MAG: hypothetical protein MUF61_02845 [archaeon]|jgi:hypothetical protein|nr:hypothetical protein [archaeon]
MRIHKKPSGKNYEEIEAEERDSIRDEFEKIGSFTRESDYDKEKGF